MKPYVQSTEGLYLLVKVQPNASKNQIQGFQGERLKISINAVPEKGKANKTLLQFLSKTLKISKQQIEIVSGETTPLKKILLKNYTLKAFEQQLLNL